MSLKKMSQSAASFDTDYLPDSVELIKQFQEFLVIHRIYKAAIKEVSTKLEILNDEFKESYDHNPIRHMENRLKSPQSIMLKLKRNGFEVSVQSACENLNDIAGIRVVCCYIDDIYQIAELLLKQKDLTLIKRKDYIAYPKENGYRSLHLVVKIPVFLSNRVESVPVEIQIRTVAMDFWASLEHQLRYKQDKNTSQLINAELLQCAESAAALDIKMQNLYKTVSDRP